MSGSRSAPASESFSAASVLAALETALGGRHALARRASGDLPAEWDSLAREREAEGFFEGLLALAERQERAGHLEVAAELYAAVAETRREGPLGARAQGCLDAILGRGASGTRAEFLGRRLAGEACDPAMLAAMGVAGFAFRMTRLAALSRLALAPSPQFLTRGLGARLMAGTAGFLSEAPAFTLAHRAADTLLGRETAWTGDALRRDFTAGALTLLSLRLTGGLGQAALARWARGTGLGAATARTLVPSALMYGGLLLSRRLEEGLGLREPLSEGTAAVDALAALLSFHAGGRLARAALGESAAAQERALETQTRILDALNGPRPAGALRAARRRILAGAPGLAALGTGLHALLLPGRAWAQDPGAMGAMGIFEPEILLGLLSLAGGGLAYGIKRVYDHYWGQAAENPQFFARHRGRILSGLGGPPPSDAPIPGEEALLAQRLPLQHEDNLYREASLEELLLALEGGPPPPAWAFRSDGRRTGRRAGPRVFDVGVDMAAKTLTRILELTHPLPQTPLPERQGEDETLFRVGHRVDLQHYADALQKPILALPLRPGSEYHLAIPLYHSGAGYVLPTYTRGVRGITAEQFGVLGALGGLLDGGHGERAASRPFLIENDGKGYLVMDWQSSQLETVPKSVQELARTQGVRVNGQPLDGPRPSRPLANGDRLQMGNQELLWIVPRPGFRMALIRTERPVAPAPEPALLAFPGGDRSVERILDARDEFRIPRREIPPELLARFQEIFPAPLLRLPDLVYEAEGGVRILLSPRLLGGARIPVGTNPGPGGIFLHGAWNPRAGRYAIEGRDVEFYLRQEGEAFFVEAAEAATGGLRLFREESASEEIPIPPHRPVELRDGDILEFGPAARRTRLIWFRNLDARRRE